MSLAENLLNSLDETAYQNMRIAGGVPEEHIKVGQDRVITVPNSLKTIAVKGDKDIETATIDCVRYWDGHDLSTFAIYLNYILPNGDEGTYIPQSITKSEDTFSFDWLIGSEFTYAQGKMTFWIVAKLTDDVGTLKKQWSSFQNSDCTIAQGGDKIYVPEKQTDQDVISQAISISRASAEIAEQQANLAKQAAVKAASEARDSAEAEVSRIIGELGVVQELGNSPNSVVSQAKVTKELGAANAKIDRNFKAIENIKAGIPADEFETDDSVAYQKDVPANALPYAAVQKLGGMTYKNGDTLRSAKVTEVKSVGVNLFNLTEEMLGDSYINGISNIVINNSNSITCKALFPDGQSYIIYGQRFPSGVCTCRMSTADIGRIIVRLYNASDEIISDAFTIEGMRYNDFYKGFYADANELVINVPADVACWRIGLYFGKVDTIETISNIQVSKGTGVPYTPYVKHTLPIPSEVRPANGINENVYDYIEWAEDGSVKKTVKCGVVDLGTLDWGIYEGYIHATLTKTPKQHAVGICAPYDVVTFNYSLISSGQMVIYDNGFSADAKIILKDDSYTDAASFKATMSGVMLVYELAEPIVTDISDLITADNLIGVEGGGTLTFENKYGYAVPSEVEYQVEV